jgi:hypothetical protein
LKAEGGTYVVPVTINGKMTLDFTLHSGAVVGAGRKKRPKDAWPKE